jgi:peptidoglycan hydrolase-like protein with peptidoglycan-binding domain
MKLKVTKLKATQGRTTVNYGPKTMTAVRELQQDLGIEGVSDISRLAITVLYAMSNAEKRGLQIQLVGANKRVYRYSLIHPKQMVAQNALPSQVPEVISLVDAATSAQSRTKGSPVRQLAKKNNVVPLHRAARTRRGAITGPGTRSKMDN